MKIRKTLAFAFLGTSMLAAFPHASHAADPDDNSSEIWKSPDASLWGAPPAQQSDTSASANTQQQDTGQNSQDEQQLEPGTDGTIPNGYAKAYPGYTQDNAPSAPTAPDGADPRTRVPYIDQFGMPHAGVTIVNGMALTTAPPSINRSYTYVPPPPRAADNGSATGRPLPPGSGVVPGQVYEKIIAKSQGRKYKLPDDKTIDKDIQDVEKSNPGQTWMSRQIDANQ